MSEGAREPAVRDPVERYRALEAQRIVETVSRLRRRIEERFPGSGLGRVCEELLQLARRAESRAVAIGRPIVALRVASGLFVLLILAATALVLITARLPQQSITATDLVQVLEAAINDVVLIGAAIFFLFTIEVRIKRRRALAALHELRSIAHIIDMHQLTKDPERLLGRGPPTAHSPRSTMTPFQLNRYLDYCSEMLSLDGKLAALYAQAFDDPVALAAVNDLEDLCSGLARKIWQKIMVIESIAEQLCEEDLA